MNTFSSDIGPEEEDGGGWGGLLPDTDEKVSEACRLIGELAFEHGVHADEPMLYRLTYWRGVGVKRVRCTDYYAELVIVRARIARINAAPDMELIDLRSYEQVKP